MNYHKFLGKTETLVAPHFGGVYVEARGRRLRLDAPLGPGWWKFEIKGKKATLLENRQAETENSALDNLPVVRGHALGDRLVRNGAVAEPIYFLPEDRPQLFAPLAARRWPRGQLLFAAVEFEGGAEEAARRAFEERRSLAEERGVPATLRAAFGYAVALEVARELEVTVSPAELAGGLVDFAGANGRELARQKVQAIANERAEHERRETSRRRFASVRERARTHGEDAEERADAALASAGADLLNTRKLSGGLLEVSYRFFGERFTTIVERDSLRVVDAGICLAGEDDLVTLESLPGVIREAIDDERLVITR